MKRALPRRAARIASNVALPKDSAALPEPPEGAPLASAHGDVRHYPAALHHYLAVGEIGKILPVVRDDDHQPFFALPTEQLGDLGGVLGIEIARRFVRVYHGPIARHRAQHRRPLTLARGQLVRHMVGDFRQLVFVRELRRTRVAPAYLGGQTQVLAQRERFYHAAVLEHVRARRAPARISHGAARGSVQPRQYVEQRGLAAAAVPRNQHQSRVGQSQARLAQRGVRRFAAACVCLCYFFRVYHLSCVVLPTDKG